MIVAKASPAEHHLRREPLNFRLSGDKYPGLSRCPMKRVEERATRFSGHLRWLDFTHLRFAVCPTAGTGGTAHGRVRVRVVGVRVVGAGGPTGGGGRRKKSSGLSL